MTTEALLTLARDMLKAQGRKVELISMRLVRKKTKEAFLFKGKEDEKTVRFVAVFKDGQFTGLEEITTSERKWIGRSAHTDLETYRVQQAEKRSQQKKVRKPKVRKFAPKPKSRL